jgi:hypothetical protein
MHILMFIEWLNAHPKITIGIYYAIAAGVITMPHPGVPCSWLTAYTWLYDWLQAILPQKFQRVVPAPTPK